MNALNPLMLRAIGVLVAMGVAVLMALITTDGTLGLILATIIGGGLGAFFFWQADRKAHYDAATAQESDPDR